MPPPPKKDPDCNRGYCKTKIDSEKFVHFMKHIANLYMSLMYLRSPMVHMLVIFLTVSSSAVLALSPTEKLIAQDQYPYRNILR